MAKVTGRPWSDRSQSLLRKAVTDPSFVSAMNIRGIPVAHLQLWIVLNDVPNLSRADLRCWLEDWAHANPNLSVGI